MTLIKLLQNRAALDKGIESTDLETAITTG
jgi:hypothetical protein